jgi:outer membrane protein OmpA-like peptidoglycan-associated protein
MPSPLDFPSSEVFRKKLVVRNLVPYKKSYAFSPPQNYEVIQRDLSPVDSNDALIDTPVFANDLYPLNQYGADGGYTQVANPNTLNNTNSNEGEYGFQDADLVDEGPQAAQVGFPGVAPAWKPLNVFGNNSNAVLDSAPFFDSFDTVSPSLAGQKYYNNQPYPTFVSSFYSPSSILLRNDPQGSDGLLSQDSFIAQLGARRLKDGFEQRIADGIRQNTLDRINILNAAGGTGILNIIMGRTPILEPVYKITVGGTVLGAAADFIARISGTYAPYSIIPGSYWDPSINSKQGFTTQQLAGAYSQANLFSGLGRFFGRLLGSPKSGSVLFLENTGTGTKNLLFGNLDYNRYKPGYNRTFFDRLRGGLVGGTEDDSNYYIGSPKSEPGDIFSPSGDLPVDQFGREISAPVYGPQELAQLYEGPSKAVKLGANGPTYSSGGDILGGFTWVSPKYRGNAGKKVGIGGEIIADDPDFPSLGYQNTESTNNDFRDGSILDQTQRLIDSQPRGGRRLQHVGNAIDQVSKVFNDGYKELTKGSRVIRYVGATGQERGAEYCRVFQKDTPYLQYNDLQKQDGITTSGRKFAYSVLDNTYNLNIAPMKGNDSTNITPEGAKKYMFSIENLAWRTSNRPGLSVQDLPVCERGPNGGRVMWFPPYGLEFSEQVQANFKPTDFIGRVEPVYTYNNTSRTGSLQWQIVVDHPSVLNLIVNRVLANEQSRERVQGLLDSFFAGCKKYDLYELAEKYYQFNTQDLFEIQQKIQSKNVTTEEIRYLVNTVQTGDGSTGANGTPGGGNTNIGSQTANNTDQTKTYLESFNNYGLYFENDYPLKDQTVENYTSYYSVYTNANTRAIYDRDSANPSAVNNFFPSVIEFNKNKLQEMLYKLDETLKINPDAKVELILEGSASKPQTVNYNDALSQRRLDSVVQYIRSIGQLANAIDVTKQLTLVLIPKGENTTVQPVGQNNMKFETFNCANLDADRLSRPEAIYSVNAMSCRRVKFNLNVNIPSVPKTPPIIDQSSPKYQSQISTEVSTKTTVEQVVETTTSLRDNITKRVLRKLLSECDYFELIRQETPMVYDNLRDKLKFFHPAFHSITPEGLNGRLTFLQQCMRPGDTIPTVKNATDGSSSLEYNNAVNTAFGAPPVLILRVGDFYHSKIIPNSLGISYEQLDLNPEGIGVQPMIAKIQLSFNFVGGQGLKTAVDKLQNALSFNFYANTEIYDDRADATDDSYKILDQQFIKNLGIEVPPPVVTDTEDEQTESNAETIGKVLTTEIGENETTGTIDYQQFMTQFVGSTQNYFTTVLNKNKDILKQYNNAVRQIIAYNRNYQYGDFYYNIEQKYIFGKPSTIQQSVDSVFSKFINDIDDNLEGFMLWMSNPTKNFSNKSIRQLKENYISFIRNKQSGFQNALTSIINELVNTQTSYIQQLNRTNVITYPNLKDGTDGFKESNGNIVVYEIEGTDKVSANYAGATKSTYNELTDDLTTITDSLFQFTLDIENTEEFTFDNQQYESSLIPSVGDTENYDSGSVFEPITLLKYPEFWENDSNRRQYFILNKDVTDSNLYQSFKDALIANILNNPTIIGNQATNFGEQFDAYWIGPRPSSETPIKTIYNYENNAATTFLDGLATGPLKKYVIYTPYNDINKGRLFTYTINTLPVPPQIDLIKSLGLKNNSDTNKTVWSTEITTDVVIGKVQLL